MNPKALELLAKLLSYHAVVLGFQAANQQRAAIGMSAAYGEEAFNQYATLMEQIADQARAAAGGGDE